MKDSEPQYQLKMADNYISDRVFKKSAMPGLILSSVSPGYTVLDFNESFAAFAEIGNEDIRGRTFKEIGEAIARMNTLEEFLQRSLTIKSVIKTVFMKHDRTGSTGLAVEAVFCPIFTEADSPGIIQVSFITGSGDESKKLEEALQWSNRRFLSLVHSVEGIVWEADAVDFRFTFISDQVENILGYTVEEWLKDPDFWKKHIHPADRDFAINYCHIKTQELSNHTFDYRMLKADGSVIWIRDIVSVISEKERPQRLRGLMVDITTIKHLTELEKLEKQVLKLNSENDVPVKKVLAKYLEGIEHIFPGMHCSILRVRGGRLFKWASVSLPESYEAEIEGTPIAMNNGSCGTAAFLKQSIFVEDISTDPHWVNFRYVVAQYGLRACWSVPIINSAHEVIAVWGMYYTENKLPDEEELKVIERSSALLKVVLENRRNLELLEETSLLMKQGQEIAHFGIWSWNVEIDTITWSDSLFQIYGLNSSMSTATYETYLELLHPADRDRISGIIQELLRKGNDIEYEERIIRPDGELRYLHSWVRVRVNKKGKPTKIIGASLDITEKKKAEEEKEKKTRELEESEKRYSDLFHLSSLPMWVYDLHTLRFLNVNEAAVKQYGYTREEFLSMKISDIRPEEDISLLLEKIEMVKLHPKGYFHGILRHKRKSGEVFKVDIQSNFIPFKGKKALLVLAADVTDQENYLRAVEKQNQKLKEIAWIQSHVVRAPLARIMALIYFLKNYDECPMDMNELTSYISDSADELDQIIRDISEKAGEIELRTISRED